MRILAIETSSRAWGVALLDAEIVVAQPWIDVTLPISRVLLPRIQAGVVAAGWVVSQFELIGVTQGPGAFTGLRVGVTAAKTLAYALGCPLVACNSLELIAAATASARGWTTGEIIRPIMDAQRSEFFVGRYRTQGPWRLESIAPVTILNSEDLNSSLSPDEILTGPGLMKWTPTKQIPIADPILWNPDAALLGRLARQHFERGGTHDPFALVPEYYRPSYAEEKPSAKPNLSLDS